MDEAIDGMLEDARQSPSYAGIAAAWDKAMAGVQEEGISQRTTSLDDLAVQIFKECTDAAPSGGINIGTPKDHPPETTQNP